MKNRDYWRKRFEALTEAELFKGEHYLQDLEKQYHRAEKSLQDDINAWYVRFAKNNNISLIEAKRLLNTRELEEFRWTVEEYIKHGEENALSGEWIKELENASARVHVSRLESLQVQLQQHAEEVYGNHLDSTDRLLRSIYEDGYYHTAFEVQKGLGVGISFARLDTDRIEKVLVKPWAADGMDFSARIWKDRTQLVDSLHTKLTQAVIRGDAPDRMIAEIAKRFDVSRTRAGRLVMTESAFFAGASQRDCFNELGVERYEVVETLDGNTCPVCGDMDGRVFKMSEYEPGVTAPLFHANCRGCTCPYFDDEEDGERISRDPMTGKSENTTAKTYEEWRAGLDKKYGEGRDEYKQIQNSELRRIPTLDTFQTQRYNNSPEYQELMQRYANVQGIGNWKAVEFNSQTLASHFQNHGSGVNASSADEYKTAALKFVNEVPEKEMIITSDGVKRFYLRSTNEFASVYPDGTISTYYKPRHGEKYWEGQMKKYGKK